MSKSSAKTPPPAKPASGRKAAASAPAPKAAAKKASAVTAVAKKSPVKAPAKPTPVKIASAPSIASKKAPAGMAPPAKAVAVSAPAGMAPPAKAVAVSAPAAKKAPPVNPVPTKAATIHTPPLKSSASKAASAALAAAKSPPVTKAAPPAPINRFSERFSPPKPPARGYPEPMEILRTAYKADPKLVNAWKTKAAKDLTEPELLAMPEAEYMNVKQLEFFRLRLQALKDDLLSNAGETTEHLREDTSIVPDPADRATIEEEHALELRTRDRERKLLKKIQQSLGRIESSDYGFCDETGEPIGLGRLLARPTATLSLEAQQRREMKQKMFGD